MRARRLDPAQAYKPLDVGEAGVTASIDGRGRLLYVAQHHPTYGVATLVASAPLPPERRYDQEAVRRHRRRYSARNAAGFGLQPERGHARRGQGPAWLLEEAIPATGVPGSAKPLLATFVPHPEDTEGARGVLQVVLAPGASLEWRGSVRLAPAEYPELTEIAPPPSLRAAPEASRNGRDVAIHDAKLGWSAALSGDFTGEIRLEGRAERARLTARLRPGGRIAAIGLGTDAEEALAAARLLAKLDPHTALERELERWRARWAGWPGELGRLEDVARRGVAYTFGCCAAPVGDAVCLVTDHRILPLSWTRDGYYMAHALLAWHEAGGPREAADLVRRHLEWLFGVAERPEGWWARAHLVGGKRKDPAFQLDQQLYPLLELCDYVAITSDSAPLERHASQVERVLRAVERRRAPLAPLYATEETPADEPLDLPYQTANQILLWRTLVSLHRLGLGGGRLGELAKEVATAVRDQQIVPGPDGRPLFAYATDLQGEAHLYHDANDLPLALAPSWGFCPPDDPVWRATVEFAFSSANPGFFTGRNGGLGSLHTPAPWPLGHVQSLLIGRATGDSRLVAASEQALVREMLWDAALPEASDPRSGLPVSRPWFAWPGAATAASVLGSLPKEDHCASRSPSVT